MPSISGKYQLYKNENVDDFFIAVGVPFIGRKMIAMSSPVMEITLDGDNIMTIKNTSLFITLESKFQLGVEYEEKMPNALIKVNCNTSINNEVPLSITKMVKDTEIVTESVILKSGAKCGRHYLFSDDECIVTLTHEKVQTPSKRYFRRVQ